jgi:GNAT superfamily N-acetyltransferase
MASDHGERDRMTLCSSVRTPTVAGKGTAMGGQASRWRLAAEGDDDVVVEMCLSLYREDPGALGGGARHMRGTLDTLRREPWRGRAVVLEVGHRVVGYALLIALWSNEIGGEVCEVDELYVSDDSRGRGHGSALFRALDRGELWPAPLAAVALGVTPGNARARRLYEALGFDAVGVNMVKKRDRSPVDEGRRDTQAMETTSSQAPQAGRG